MEVFFFYNLAVLGNWINLSDWRRLLEKLRQNQLAAALRRLGWGRKKKIRRTWEENRSSPPIHFWNIPEVKRHWNRCVSGDPGISHRDYVAGRYLAGKGGLLALSPGCGSGGNEREWADLGCFARIDAFDLSPVLVGNARETAVRNGWAAVLNFFVADARKFAAPENHYDMILAEGSLHHLAPMDTVLASLRRWLKPGGLLLVNDFVGPSRFQWNRRQVHLAESLLSVLPGRLRRQWNGGIKRHIDAPGRLRMRLADPSEAAASFQIRPLLERHFEVLETKEKGGTIINLLLFGIAHHFCGDDAEAADYLRLFLELESRLIASGEIASDFILAVCRKQTQ